MIGEGANEVLRVFIGVVGMRDVGMQLKQFKDAFGNPLQDYSTISRFLKSSFYRLHAPTVPVKSSLIEPEAKRLGKAVRKFGFAVIQLLAKYRENIIEKQFQLDRIATSAIAIYTTTAVLSKLDTDLMRNQISSGTVAAARLYCQQAMDQVDKALGSMWSNRDDEMEKVSDLLIEGSK